MPTKSYGINCRSNRTNIPQISEIEKLMRLYFDGLPQDLRFEESAEPSLPYYKLKNTNGDILAVVRPNILEIGIEVGDSFADIIKPKTLGVLMEEPPQEKRTLKDRLRQVVDALRLGRAGYTKIESSTGMGV